MQVHAGFPFSALKIYDAHFTRRCKHNNNKRNEQTGAPTYEIDYFLEAASDFGTEIPMPAHQYAANKFFLPLTMGSTYGTYDISISPVSKFKFATKSICNG